MDGGKTMKVFKNTVYEYSIFIHSVYFYSASSSPILSQRRSRLYSIDTVSELPLSHHATHLWGGRGTEPVRHFRMGKLTFFRYAGEWEPGKVARGKRGDLDELRDVYYEVDSSIIIPGGPLKTFPN